MNATFTVTFKGFPAKLAGVLEQWLRDDIAAYPKRMAMDSATVVKPKLMPKQKEKAHAKSR